MINTDQLRDLREAGLGVVQVASVLSVPPAVVLHKLMTALELSDLDPRASVHLERSEVAQRVTQGMTTQQIAEDLGLSKNQVRHHRIARSGELSRAKERGSHGVRRADRTGSAAGLQRGDAGQGQPQKERPVRSNTGVRGVSYLASRDAYSVSSYAGGRSKWVGSYKTLTEAAAAAEQARMGVPA